MALHEAGRPGPATEVLRRVLTRHPYDRDTLSALVGYAREEGNLHQAQAYARELALLEPRSVELRQLVARLEAEAR